MLRRLTILIATDPSFSLSTLPQPSYTPPTNNRCQDDIKPQSHIKQINCFSNKLQKKGIRAYVTRPDCNVNSATFLQT